MLGRTTATIEITCAFTGHRSKRFPWKYDENACDCVLLKEVLAEQIRELIARDVTTYLSGMALGGRPLERPDRPESPQRNPALQLYCILSCEGQEDKWPALEKERYYSILRQANHVVYVNREYKGNCMLERNRYMMDHSSFLLVVYNGKAQSGTGSTVNNARRMGQEIVIINSLTWIMNCEGKQT